MKKLIYGPQESGRRMNIVCFVSGSGTNYREIVKKNPAHNYIVFTNRPGCAGTEIARINNHPVIELSHIPYLKETREKYGAGKVPRNCPERIKYEQALCVIIEQAVGRQPDLICLAGYDQWTTDWLVDRYYPRILNIHPGDTTKGYDGLHWIPSAKAIIAGDAEIRSTLFMVDKGEDTGPVLLQSQPINIIQTMKESSLNPDFKELLTYLKQNDIQSYKLFVQKAGESQIDAMASICNYLLNRLKEKGDWDIYPRGVQMIAEGRVAIDGRTVLVDNIPMPVYGYRL